MAKSWVDANADATTCMLSAINQIRPSLHWGRCMPKPAVTETCFCSVILCYLRYAYRMPYCRPICCLYCSVSAENTLLCFNFTPYFFHVFAPKYAKICASVYENASASGGLRPQAFYRGSAPGSQPRIPCSLPQPKKPADATAYMHTFR